MAQAPKCSLESYLLSHKLGPGTLTYQHSFSQDYSKPVLESHILSCPSRVTVWTRFRGQGESIAGRVVLMWVHPSLQTLLVFVVVVHRVSRYPQSPCITRTHQIRPNRLYRAGHKPIHSCESARLFSCCTYFIICLPHMNSCNLLLPTPVLLYPFQYLYIHELPTVFS